MRIILSLTFSDSQVIPNYPSPASLLVRGSVDWNNVAQVRGQWLTC
jgi:hypothetical protein